MQDIRVVAYGDVEALEPLRRQIDELNLASRRPCAFASFEYIRAFVRNDEFAQDGETVLFLCAFRGEALAGYLPLRRCRRKVLGLPVRTIELLVWHDTDRPHVVAAAADEAACCEAFYRHLARAERWSAVELVAQDADSGLWPVRGLPAFGYQVRQFENLPNTTVPLAPTLAEYYRGLGGEFRNAVARMSRRVLNAGEVVAISSHHPAARRPLLDLYLDVERRSWKQEAQAGITRHPRRLAFFESLCAPEQALQLAVDLILVDGVPISGMISGTFEGQFYAFETAYDGAYGDLSPGYLTWLLAIRHGIVQGLRSYNLQSSYAYYKARWNGTNTPTFAVQVHRVGGLPWLKGKAGELKRWLLRRPPAPVLFNEVKRGVEGKPSGDPAARPGRAAEAERAAAVLAGLEAAGAEVERLSGAALRAALPFDPDAGGKKKPKA